MVYKQDDEKIPSGGDYSEIYYLDSDNNVVDKAVAVRCVIRECNADGTIIQETWGRCNQ